jgi:Tol biopolymer transport system component
MKKLFFLIPLIFLLACGGTSPHNSVAGSNAVPVTLNMTTAATLVNQSAQFTANIPVNWSVTEKNGGIITSAGLYTAPANLGSFHVVATSVADPSKSATAIVNTSAQFLSLQKLPNGTSQPWSVTPILTVFNSDGSFKSASVIDPATNQPLDTNAVDIHLSPDGSKAVATVITNDPACTVSCSFYNIAVADTKTLQVTLVTHNETITDRYSQDWEPQFSPDGKTIIYTHRESDLTTFDDSYSIRKMNVDGSNVQTVFAQSGVQISTPTFSPDGKLIAVSASQVVAGVWYDGIATMSADGTNLVQLTGPEANFAPCGGWDELPAFTADGKKIAFARQCWPDSGGLSEQLYVMNLDGTGVTPVHGSGAAGYIAWQPRTLATDHIIFSSNETGPGTDSSFDMWSIAADGTNATQITNNNLYDGFSVEWMNYYEATAAARAFQAHSPRQQRLDHKKMLQNHMKR